MIGAWFERRLEFKEEWYRYDMILTLLPTFRTPIRNKVVVEFVRASNLSFALQGIATLHSYRVYSIENMQRTLFETDIRYGGTIPSVNNLCGRLRDLLV